MRKPTFDYILSNEDIGWGDKVAITVINPHYKRKWYDPFGWFSKPKTITYIGYLNYSISDDYVTLFVEEHKTENNESFNIYYTFEFNHIVGVNGINSNQC